MRGAVFAVSLVAVALLLTAAIPSAASSRAHPSFLAFVTVKYVDGGHERGTIWTADLDGLNRQRLAAGNVPDISPDGRWIAFRDNAGNLRVIEREGGASRVLARDVEWGFDWAPDSRRIAVVVGGHSLVVVDVASRRRTTIDRADAIWGFSFSPAGDQIVWGRKAATNTATTGGVDIFRGSASGGHVRRLTRDRGSETPIWGPDGVALARFEPFTLLHPVLELWFMQPDGRGLRSINPHNLAPFAWSRDGRRLLAYADSEVDSRPYAVDPASGTARSLVKGGAETFTAAFSRDGRWVLATHNGKLVQVSWAGGRQRILARGVDEVADWTR